MKWIAVLRALVSRGLDLHGVDILSGSSAAADNDIERTDQ